MRLALAFGPRGARLATLRERIYMFPLNLEDRILKHRFRDLSKNCSLLRMLTKKPTVAQADEIQHNPRARSAALNTDPLRALVSGWGWC
ncbi:16S rRNA (cytosine(1402)-N(4))-methyltransferase [Moorena producens]|uniref:16S rRNA (cytosine(1402)-N(4))-methyltransferase n=1 Tax=Moorena producens TaxID=1155739 RepID=UPI003C78DA8E